MSGHARVYRALAQIRAQIKSPQTLFRLAIHLAGRHFVEGAPLSRSRLVLDHDALGS